MAGDEELGQLALDALAWSGDAEARTDRFLADLGYSRAPATFRASGATTP